MALTLDDLRQALDPIWRRIRLIASRALLTADADDSQGCQRVAIALLADEERTGVARVQQYGLTSVPPSGSEAVCVAVGGSREHLVALAVDSSSARPTGLKVGEVALWMKELGLRVYALDDGTIEIGTNPTDFVALASKVKSEFDSLKGDVDRLKTHALTHQHTSAAAGSPTTPAVPTVPPLALEWSPGEVAAEEVKAK